MRKVLILNDGTVPKEDFLKEDAFEKMKAVLPPDFEIAFIDDFATTRTLNKQEAHMRLEKEGPEWVEPEQAVLDALADAEIAVIHYSAAGKRFFEAAPKLKLLCVMRSGVENVNMEAAREHNVVVSRAPGRASEPVSDFTVTLMLAINRHIESASIVRHQNAWPMTKARGKMLCNSVVGLVGFGVIGAKVAKKLSGFGTKVIAYDPYCKPEVAAQYGVELIPSLDDVLKRSDFVSLHARYAEGTKGMIGKHELSMMKPDAYLVNTARAGLVDEQALVEALQNKTIAGAAMDVYWEEPLQDDHPLYSLDNVLLTPHMAGAAGSVLARSLPYPLQAMEDYSNGAEISYRVS